MRRGVAALAALAGVATFAACVGAPMSQPAGPSGARPETPDRAVGIPLIILFRKGVDPSDPAFLTKLSAHIGMPLAYLRPLSGGAHLLRASVPPDLVTELVERLQRRPEILDVKPDVAVRRQ